MTLRIRLAEKSDRPAIFKLFASVFGTAPRPEEWKWKYDDNPAAAASVVAFDGDEVIGYFGGFGTRFFGNGRVMPGTSGVDVMTSPDARRLGHGGVYRELGVRFVAENLALGIPFYFGFPNDRHGRVGERLLGFRTVERAGQWTSPVLAEPPRPGIRNWFRPVRRIERFSSAHDSLAAVLKDRPGFRTDKSREGLNWRYFDRPGVSYQILEATGPSRRSLGYAVVRVVGDQALLVDLQARDEEGGTYPDLVAAATTLARNEGLRSLALRASRKGLLATRAIELGFEEVASDTCLNLIPIDPGFPLETAIALFDYRFGDHDIF